VGRRVLVFIVEYVRNVKSHFYAKQGIMVTQSSEWDESQAWVVN